MKLDIIIPLGRMADGKGLEQRLEILRFTISSAKVTGLTEVMIVCQDVPEADEALKKLPCRLIHIKGKPFNKGWCQNVGVVNTKADYICLAESDMWCPWLLEKVPMWMETKRARWCFGWNQLYYANQAETRDFMDHGIRPSGRGHAIVRPTRGYSEGGYVFFRRDFYWRFGGASEWYKELGGPDNDMAFRAQHVSKTYHAFPTLVFHLWHPKVKRRRSALRAENVRMLRYTHGHPDAVIRTMREMAGGLKMGPYCDRESFSGARKRICG